MNVAPKLIPVDDVDIPIELKPGIIGIFKPVQKTRLMPMCNITLNASSVGKFPPIVFDPKNIKKVGDVFVYSLAFQDNSRSIQCHIRINKCGKKMFFHSVMFSKCEHDDSKDELFEIEMVDDTSDNIEFIDIITYPKDGAVKITSQCGIVLMNKKIGMFKIKFIKCETILVEENKLEKKYIFENAKDNSESIHVTISITTDGDNMYLTNARFVSGE
jgi:hypothetical protein